MSNTLLTTSYIVNTGLSVLENELIFADKVNRQYSDEFAIKEAKIGATVNIRRPPRYLGTFGPALNVEDTNETYIPVSLNYQYHVDVQFTTADLLLSMDLFKTRVLKPMIATVANRIDNDGCYFGFQSTALSVGTPGSSPSSIGVFNTARATLVSEAPPAGMTPCLILDPITTASVSTGLSGLFNPQAKISENYETGMVASKTAGFDWFESQNIPSWTTGAQGGSPVLSGVTASAGGSAILTSGWAQTGVLKTSGWTSSAAARLVVGDILQIAGVYPANPQSRTQYGKTLKQFVVLPPGGYAQINGSALPGGPPFAPATLTNGTFNAATGVYSSTSGGALDVVVGECLISGGQFQNCVTTSSFTGTPAITVNGGTGNANTVSPQGLGFYRDAFALAFADLPLPRGVEEAARANDSDVGMSIRMVTQYTVNNDAMPTRADVLYGYSSMYRQQAIRIAG